MKLHGFVTTDIQLVQQSIESPTVPHCLFRMETDLRLHQVLLFLMKLSAHRSSIRLSGGCGVQRCEILVIIQATCIHSIAHLMWRLIHTICHVKILFQFFPTQNCLSSQNIV
jgi:hypothetical protein